ASEQPEHGAWSRVASELRHATDTSQGVSMYSKAPRPRWAVLAAVTTAALALGAGTALASPSDLDPKFSQDGWTAINSGGNETGYATVVQPDGKILVAGASTVNDNAVVYRLNPDGSLDTTFDGDGALGIDTGGLDIVRAMALQPDGKIVVVGETSLNLDAAVYRLNPNGTFDTSFNGGAVYLDSGHQERANAVAIQPDGKILVAGSTDIGYNAVVWRLNPNGTKDATFDADGAVAIDSGGSEVARALALQ